MTNISVSAKLIKKRDEFRGHWKITWKLLLIPVRNDKTFEQQDLSDLDTVAFPNASILDFLYGDPKETSQAGETLRQFAVFCFPANEISHIHLQWRKFLRYNLGAHVHSYAHGPHKQSLKYIYNVYG